MKRCDAYGCCEPAAGLAIDYCGQHQQLVCRFARWLKGDTGDLHKTDARLPFVSFDHARARWEPPHRLSDQRHPTPPPRPAC